MTRLEQYSQQLTELKKERKKILNVHYSPNSKNFIAQMRELNAIDLKITSIKVKMKTYIE